MIPFTCPKCGTELEIPNSEAGKKVACPDCGTRVQVTAPAPAKKAAGASSVTTKRPAAKGPTGSGSRRTNGKAAPRPDTKSKRRPRDDEDDDEDESPRNKKKKKKGSSSGLLVGLGIGGGVLVVGGAVVLIVVLMSGKGKDNPAPSNPPPAPNMAMNPMMGTARGPGAGMPGMPGMPGTSANGNASATESGTKPDEQTTKTEKEKPPEEVPVATGPVSDERIYKYLLKSVVLIIRPEAGGFSQGSGSIIDKTNRLILTNYHVAKEAGGKVFVFFPAKDKEGNLISDRNHFLEQAKADAALTANVVWSDKHVDLALVQLKPDDKIPDDERALSFANRRPDPGAHVISVGNPGSSDGSSTLWTLTRGSVRQFKPKMHYLSGDATEVMSIDADVLLTDSPTNHGDSGGPLVNDRGEIVGVVQSANVIDRLVSIFIAVSEVKNLVASYARTSGVKLALETKSSLAGEEDSENLPKLLRALASKDPNVRANAARNIGAMGSGGQPAVPALLKQLNDSDDVAHKMALEALDKIGAPALGDLGTLTAALKDKNPEARLYAVRALAELGPDGRSAVDPLLEALKDKDPALRRGAAKALGAVGLDAKDQVQPALVEAMKDPDAGVRAAAAAALPVLPMSPADAPLLVGLLKNPDAGVRAGAAHALAKTGADAKVTMKPLADALQDSSGPVRQAALEGLMRFGEDAKDYVPAMSRALRDPDLRVQQAAADALGAVGPDAKSASKALAEAAQSPELRKSAIGALGRIGPAAAKDAAPLLVNMLNLSSADDRLLALTALAGLKPTGPEAQELIPKVIRAFEDRDPRVRAQASVTLGLIGKPAVESLIRSLNDPNKNVRIGAVTALGNIGSAAGLRARNAITILGQIDRDPDVQKACVAALAAMQR